MGHPTAPAIHDLGGTGRSLLFAHATGLHGSVWTPLARLLADGFHSWAFDFRGHGRSPAPADGDFHWSGFGEDVLMTLDRLRLERPIGIGHSMGGTALVMAELARPGSFAALVLFEPALFPSQFRWPDGQRQAAAAARRRRSTFADKKIAYATYSAKAPFDQLTEAALRAYVEDGFIDTPDGARLRCSGESEARAYEMSSEHDTVDRLGELRLPVLVLAGPPQPRQLSACAEPVAALVPGARYRAIDGAGHFGPLQLPGPVASTIRQFVRDEVEPPADGSGAGGPSSPRAHREP